MRFVDKGDEWFGEAKDIKNDKLVQESYATLISKENN